MEQSGRGYFADRRRHLQKLNQRQRETCPASELVVGMCSAVAAMRFLV